MEREGEGVWGWSKFHFYKTKSKVVPKFGVSRCAGPPFAGSTPLSGFARASCRVGFVVGFCLIFSPPLSLFLSPESNVFGRIRAGCEGWDMSCLRETCFRAFAGTCSAWHVPDCFTSLSVHEQCRSNVCTMRGSAID